MKNRSAIRPWVRSPNICSGLWWVRFNVSQNWISKLKCSASRQSRQFNKQRKRTSGQILLTSIRNRKRWPLQLLTAVRQRSRVRPSHAFEISGSSVGATTRIEVPDCKKNWVHNTANSQLPSLSNTVICVVISYCRQCKNELRISKPY